MAQTIYFGGRRVKLPGVYSEIKSGIQNAPLATDYGKVLIIDTGYSITYGEAIGTDDILTTYWGGGSGVNGTLENGADSLYQFFSLDAFRDFVKGGMLWRVADALFKPYRGEPGISSLYYIKAATTVPAELSFTATGDGAAGGTFILQCKNEGDVANGVLDDNDIIRKGYAYKITTGVIDTAKWIYNIYEGTYKGENSVDGLPIDDVEPAQSKPRLIAKSPEFDNISTLIAWAETDESLNRNFVKKSTSAVTGTGVVNQADVTAVDGYNIATGGTDSFAAADLADVFDVVKELDYTFILCDRYGTTQYNNANVGSIVSHIQTEAKYEKFMFYGAGETQGQFANSKTIADYFDDDQVIVQHGGIKKASQLVGSGFRNWPAIYGAAYSLGRLAGLPPQVPLTFKQIGIDGLQHNPTELEKEQALDAGVLMTYFDKDFNGFTCLKGVNSLQSNDYLVNADASSYSIQLRRIVAQINKDLVINAKIQLLGQPAGVNRNTLSPNYVKNWTEAFLETRIAKPSQDNLILDFSNVTVTREGEAYRVTYGIVPNGEIDKILFTGFLLD